MTDKAGEAARRIEKAFTTGGAYSGDDPVTVARAYLAQAKRIEELETRLEMNFAHRMIDGVMTKVRVEPGSIPDGIECRDETIRLQDEHIAKLANSTT